MEEESKKRGTPSNLKSVTQKKESNPLVGQEVKTPQASIHVDAVFSKDEFSPATPGFQQMLQVMATNMAKFATEFDLKNFYLKYKDSGSKLELNRSMEIKVIFFEKEKEDKDD